MIGCLYIFLGGGLGALSRFGLSNWLGSGFDGSKVPLGILSCNILGCFVIGLVYALQKEGNPAWLQPLLITGFLGGFTTFSSFGLETFKLFETGNFTTTLLYVSSSVFGSLLALFLAIKIMR